MKKLSLLRTIIVFAVVASLFAACKKESADVRLNPQLSTSQVYNISSDSATVIGFVVAEGEGFSERGICYDKAPAPTTNKSKVIYTGDSPTATFTVTLGGLDYATKYYARSYAIYDNWTFYGEVLTFTTAPVVPTLLTDVISQITGNSASGGGNVTIAGGAEVTARGLCYNTKSNPTIKNSTTLEGNGTGPFTSALTNLLGNTVYYVRAYATNSAGTGYGPEVKFRTNVDLPKVITSGVTEITKISAVSGGNVTYNGGGAITARGLVWSKNPDPDLTTGTVIASTADTGKFVINLTGLEKFTTYHVRAYATNSAGTAYGSDIKFTTLADITKFFVVGTYNGWDNSDKADFIISTATNSEAQGYVWFPEAGAFKLTTDHSWDDPHTFGDNGSGQLTNPGSDIKVNTAGYQFIKANLSDMSYSVTPTTWGLIGSATPGGWDNQTDMTYITAAKILALGIHLKAGEFKFRGTPSWSVNYGATAGSLVFDGPNISVATEDDYAITLDLSHPNEYTYSANFWGIIGSATAGGWDSDQNMAWDNTGKVFKATLDLTAGEIKFRANDDWGINFGGALNALTQGGANINISAAGNYTITLDPWAKIATITKN